MAGKKKAWRRRGNPLFGAHHRRRHNIGRRAHHRRNPLPISTSEILPVVGGAVAGGVASSWIPNKIAPHSDQGLVGYAMNAAVAVGGALALNRWHPKVALGWFVGGLTMLFGRIFDDFFGKPVVTFQAPTLASYYSNGIAPLPALMGGSGANPLLSAPAAPAVIPVPAAALASKKGMGWSSSFSRKLAA